MGAEGTCGRALVVFASGDAVRGMLDVVPPEVFPFGTGGGAIFGVLGFADTVEVGGTRERGLGGGAGCFPLDTGGVGT